MISPAAQLTSPASDRGPHDDLLTLMAIALLAYILADVLHELVGHGVTAWISGAHRLTVSTIALQTDISSRWISANGTLVNLIAAILIWLYLRRRTPNQPATRYFLTLLLAANLFTGTGYFFYSGVANFGDWAAVIHGLQPYWLWRAGLIVLGVGSYYASMLLIANYLRPFLADGRSQPRLWCLTLTPYLTEGALAGIAALFNPLGLFYVIASGLSSTLGANAGLLALPSLMRGWRRQGGPDGKLEPEIPAVKRSLPWIIAGAVGSALFIFVLGRGVTWTIRAAG